MVYRVQNDLDEGSLEAGSRVCRVCEIRQDMSQFRYTNKNRTARRRVCNGCFGKQNKSWVQANRESVRANSFRYKLKTAYGLTEEQYDDMLALQDGRCLICRREFASDRRLVPHVDHCHETGRVRGILCFTCNTGIGKFNDNIEWLEAAIAYLKE